LEGRVVNGDWGNVVLQLRSQETVMWSLEVKHQADLMAMLVPR
jgi:hypothetical protein